MTQKYKWIQWSIRTKGVHFNYCLSNATLQTCLLAGPSSTALTLSANFSEQTVSEIFFSTGAICTTIKVFESPPVTLKHTSIEFSPSVRIVSLGNLEYKYWRGDCVTHRILCNIPSLVWIHISMLMCMQQVLKSMCRLHCSVDSCVCSQHHYSSSLLLYNMMSANQALLDI